MSDDVVAVLQAAKERVAEGWSQGTAEQWFYTSASGTHGTRKVCATWAIMGWSDGAVQKEALSCLSRAIGHISIIVWNDKRHRTQAEVLDAFSDAIRLAKEESA